MLNVVMPAYNTSVHRHLKQLPQAHQDFVSKAFTGECMSSAKPTMHHRAFMLTALTNTLAVPVHCLTPPSPSISASSIIDHSHPVGMCRITTDMLFCYFAGDYDGKVVVDALKVLVSTLYQIYNLYFRFIHILRVVSYHGLCQHVCVSYCVDPLSLSLTLNI